MGMNPLDYHDCFVCPNYQDFCEEENNVRKGFNAALSACHMADNYYNYYKANNPGKVSSFKQLKDFQVDLSSKTQYFNDIQSIAIAYKHLYTSYSKPHVTIESGGVITCIRIHGNNAVEIDGCGTDDSGKDIVIYTRKDLQKVRLKEALSHVLNIWQDILFSD